jgi:hypothetical protein
MAILPGRRLGPYEILSSVGAGGMGEVYRARDTRLDRIVAVKVLPAHLADHSELGERFEPRSFSCVQRDTVASTWAAFRLVIRASAPARTCLS